MWERQCQGKELKLLPLCHNLNPSISPTLLAVILKLQPNHISFCTHINTDCIKVALPTCTSKIKLKTGHWEISIQAFWWMFIILLLIIYFLSGINNCPTLLFRHWFLLTTKSAKSVLELFLHSRNWRDFIFPKTTWRNFQKTCQKVYRNCVHMKMILSN